MMRPEGRLYFPVIRYGIIIPQNHFTTQSGNDGAF